MTRKEEIKNSIDYLNNVINLATKEIVTQEQLINLNLTALANQLADISVTLAIIADEMAESKGVKHGANDNR